MGLSYFSGIEYGTVVLQSGALTTQSQRTTIGTFIFGFPFRKGNLVLQLCRGTLYSRPAGQEELYRGLVTLHSRSGAQMFKDNVIEIV